MTDRDRLLESALGQLSEAEEAEVQAALRADPALRRAYDDDLAALASLLDDLDPEQVQVPAGAEERLMARVRAEAVPAETAPALAPKPAPVVAPPPRRRAWWLAAPLALAAALALFFALRPAPADALTRYARTPGAVSREVTANGAPIGTLVRLPDGRVYVQLRRAPESGRTYQLWRIVGGTPASLGTFGPDGVLTDPLPADSTLAVSVEPPGGSPQPTTTPLFAQGI